MEDNRGDSSCRLLAFGNRRHILSIGSDNNRRLDGKICLFRPNRHAAFLYLYPSPQTVEDGIRGRNVVYLVRPAHTAEVGLVVARRKDESHWEASRRR